MSAAEEDDAIVRVSDFARALGLHGVLILSPRCPSCGRLHTFELITDIDPDQANAGDVRELLLRFADITEGAPTGVRPCEPIKNH
jgi:hypothetical protein